MHLYHTPVDNDEPVRLLDHPTECIATSVVAADKPPLVSVVDLSAAGDLDAIWIVSGSL